MEYSFKIVSTIETHDHSDKINIGDSLYNVEMPDCYSTEAEAKSAGWAILNGLDGGGAYNLALVSIHAPVRGRLVEIRCLFALSLFQSTPP